HHSVYVTAMEAGTTASFPHNGLQYDASANTLCNDQRRYLCSITSRRIDASHGFRTRNQRFSVGLRKGHPALYFQPRRHPFFASGWRCAGGVDDWLDVLPHTARLPRLSAVEPAGDTTVLAALDSAFAGRQYRVESEGHHYHDNACRHWGAGIGNVGTPHPSAVRHDSQQSRSIPVTESGLTTCRLRAADFIELPKPRITLMVLITTIVGFYMGSNAGLQLTVLLHTIVGTALVAAGASSLNQYLERELDARMLRTRSRP